MKFRVFDKLSKHIFYPGDSLKEFGTFKKQYHDDKDYEEFFISGDGKVHWHYYGIYEEGIHDLGQDRFILMQSTGIEDKNGVEIFEGDIINDNYLGIIGIVYYCQTGKWKYTNITNAINNLNNGHYPSMDDGKKFRWYSGCMKLHVYEIIGNIHENPELLNHEMPTPLDT